MLPEASTEATYCCYWLTSVCKKQITVPLVEVVVEVVLEGGGVTLHQRAVKPLVPVGLRAHQDYKLRVTEGSPPTGYLLSFESVSSTT